MFSFTENATNISLETLMSSRSLCRVPEHHIRHNMYGLGAGVGDNRRQIHRGELGELEVHRLRQDVSFRPVSLFIRRSNIAFKIL